MDGLDCTASPPSIANADRQFVALRSASTVVDAAAACTGNTIKGPKPPAVSRNRSAANNVVFATKPTLNWRWDFDST